MSTQVSFNIPDDHYATITGAGVDIRAELVSFLAGLAAGIVDEQAQIQLRAEQRQRHQETEDDLARENPAAWVVGEAVRVDSYREYNGVVYKCIQAHTTQADWTPDVTPALWSPQA